jgi:hypothetical protein
MDRHQTAGPRTLIRGGGAGGGGEREKPRERTAKKARAAFEPLSVSVPRKMTLHFYADSFRPRNARAYFTSYYRRLLGSYKIVG